MQTKLEQREQAGITWVGRLDEGVPNHKIWNGSISQENFSKDLIEKAKLNIDYYYFRSNENACMRCIDGRPDESSLKAERRAIEDGGLGPQVPGGSPASALAYRLANFDKYPLTDTIVDDIAHASTAYKNAQLPYPTGMHEDDSAQFPNTGCGAIDKQPQIMDKMVDTGAQPTIKSYVEAVLADDFDEGIYESVLSDIKILTQPEIKARYLMRTGDDRDSRIRAKEEVEKNSGKAGVEKMVGHHREAFLLINKHPDETFNRDLFCHDMDNEIQAFNYDYWMTQKAADTLYKDDPIARKKLLMARVMYATATAMVLTDGSVELAIRR